MPSTRSGRLQAAAIPVMDKEEVFDAKVVLAPTIVSSSVNKSCFTLNCSTTASMTRLTGWRSFKEPARWIRSFAAATSLSEI